MVDRGSILFLSLRFTGSPVTPPHPPPSTTRLSFPPPSSMRLLLLNIALIINFLLNLRSQFPGQWHHRTSKKEKKQKQTQEERHETELTERGILTYFWPELFIFQLLFEWFWLSAFGRHTIDTDRHPRNTRAFIHNILATPFGFLVRGRARNPCCLNASVHYRCLWMTFRLIVI